MKLGSWLIARGRISGVQLKRALLDQSFYGGHLSTSLMKLGYLDEHTLGEYLADAFQVPYAAAEKFRDIPAEVLRMIPQPLAQKHQIVPLAVEGRRLQLALMNPRDILVMDEVAFLTGLLVEPWVSSENLLLEALERYFGVPRASRETIPLADRVDEFPEAAGLRDPTSGASRSRVGSLPAGPVREEMGLDGRPLSAPAEPEEPFPTRRERDTANSPPRSLPALPRNLEEWRQQESHEPERLSPAAAVSSADSPGPAIRRVGPQPAPAMGSTGARPPLTLVSTVAPAALDEAARKLKESNSRDEVFDALLAFCGDRFLRTALFVVMQDKVIGWSGRGEGFDPARIRATVVPFGVPSIFSYFRMGSDFYFGPVPDLPANRQFYRDLSLMPPDRVLLVPILIKGRLIALLYGDYGTGRRDEPDIALYRRLVQKASLALEVLILRNKIGMI